MLRLTALWLAGLALVSLTQPAHAKPQPGPGYEATLPLPLPAAPGRADGAIFAISAGYAPLYGGTRARSVGDPLTIRLVESTTTAKSVSAKSGKDGGIGLSPPASGPFSFLNPDALKASNTSSFKGQGEAAQTSSLSATLAVTIAEVRANGTALVRGEKRMRLSQGDEWVRFSGIVRLIDVDENNTVPSTRIADARVEYAGKGALQQASKQGWLGRFFNLVSPF